MLVLLLSSLYNLVKAYSFSGLLFFHIQNNLNNLGCSELGSWHSGFFWYFQCCRGWKAKIYSSMTPLQLPLKVNSVPPGKCMCMGFGMRMQGKDQLFVSWLVLLVSEVVEMFGSSAADFQCPWLAVGILRGHCAGWGGPLILPLLMWQWE